eukprot:Pgem_evm1s9142
MSATPPPYKTEHNGSMDIEARFASLEGKVRSIQMVNELVAGKSQMIDDDLKHFKHSVAELQISVNEAIENVSKTSNGMAESMKSHEARMKGDLHTVTETADKLYKEINGVRSSLDNKFNQLKGKIENDSLSVKKALNKGGMQGGGGDRLGSIPQQLKRLNKVEGLKSGEVYYDNVNELYYPIADCYCNHGFMLYLEISIKTNGISSIQYQLRTRADRENVHRFKIIKIT